MNNLNKKVWFNVLIWLVLLAFFLHMKNYFLPIKQAFISALFDTLFLIIIFYTNLKFIFPKYYQNTRYYLLISVAFIISIAAIEYLLDSYIITLDFNDNLETRPEYFHFIRIFMGNSFIYFVATSVSLMQHNNRLIENEKLLTEEKLNTELKLLKAQINPHFIFNALNNIYSLTYMKAKNAPDSVLKLSEMLRYVFYDCSSEKVNINSELKYIENFIAFQQMKSDFSQNIKLSVNSGNGPIEIAPMLFIPFIENAFKYSRIEDKEEGFVNISIIADNKHIQFEIENNMDINNKPLAGSGTGIKNVQHRLGIIYPESHVLEISEQSDKYNVNLVIEY